MPHYNIELRNSERVWKTLEVERPDTAALRVEVARFVGSLLKDHADQIWADQDWRVDATDDSGLILFILHVFATNSAAAAVPRR